MPHAQPGSSQPPRHLVVILLAALGGVTYQYGQRQHEVSTLCAGLTPPLTYQTTDQRAAHEAARGICKGWAPRPKRAAFRSSTETP